MKSYTYPHIIEFIDSITNIVLILFVPALIIIVGYIVYTTFLFAKKDNKIINVVLILMLVASISSYLYYSFFVLDYFSLLKEAAFSLIITIMYILFSPFILMYIILTSGDIETSLFLNSDLIISDIKSWLDTKFAIDVSSATKDSFMVMFKLLTLLIFSSKIINVTRFIISSLTKKDSKKDFFIALVIFSIFFLVYLSINIQELLVVVGYILHSISVMLSGGMK